MSRVEIHLTDKSQAMLKYFQFRFEHAQCVIVKEIKEWRHTWQWQLWSLLGSAHFLSPTTTLILHTCILELCGSHKYIAKKKKKEAFFEWGENPENTGYRAHQGLHSTTHYTHTQHTRLLSISSNPISGIATNSLSLDLLFIFFMNWLIVWAPRWQKMVKNTLRSFLK